MKDSIVTRLKRARGQIDGVISMYETCRECTDVVTQIAAVRAALASVGREVLKEEAGKYARRQDRDKLNTLLKQLFAVS